MSLTVALPRRPARPLALASALAAAALMPQAAPAGVKALLVGVSDYQVLDADLRGPANDVGLMADALLARGAAAGDLTVLAAPEARLPDGVARGQPPTRAAILAGLDALAASVGPGDTAVFYFSGHGSQAPDASGDEQGGYDEILLPADAAGWKGQIGAVENAIVDDELQGRMQAILDTGATLVAILDACHSATGFRAAGGAGAERYVAPEALGIPAGTVAPEGGHVAPPLTGDFAFLYSSQSDERSFEYPLGDPADPANWYGDFTRNLAGVLTEVPDLTWAQALAAAADGLRQEQAAQTPDGEGTALSAAVFGTGAPATERLRVEGGTLSAGLLQGLAEGAEVALYPAAAGGEALGRATLAEVGAAEARLAGALPLPPLAYAEVLSPGRPPAIRIALPAPSGADTAAALAALKHIAEAGLADGIDWTEDPGSDADLRLIFADGALAVTGKDGVLDPHGPGSSPRLPALSGEDVILGFVTRAAQVGRLRAVLGRAEGRKGLALPGAGLSVSAELLAAGPDCEAAGAPAALADGGAVAHCDQVWLSLRNGSTTAQDVTVLYVDRDLNVQAIWPAAGESNRIAFGETAEAGLLIQNPAGLTGAEEIIVVAVAARDGAPRTVLTGLAAGGPTRAAGEASATEDYLTAALNPDPTRALGLGRPDPIKVTRLGVLLTAGPSQ